MAMHENTDLEDFDESVEQYGPIRLRRGEAVLKARTSRILLVLEQCHDSLNHQAVLRTAESFGIQHVWTLDPPATFVKHDKVCRKVDKGAGTWLSLRSFSRFDDLISALKADGREIWAADLNKNAEPITLQGPELPEKLALVIGREADGVSPAMLQVCDKTVYLPMCGFCESFNLSVATALILQRLFDICPEARGAMDEAERCQLRLDWYEQLVRSNPSKYKSDPRWSTKWLREDGSSDIVPIEDLRREKEVKMTPKMRRKLRESGEEAQRLGTACAPPVSNATSTSADAA